MKRGLWVRADGLPHFLEFYRASVCPLAEANLDLSPSESNVNLDLSLSESDRLRLEVDIWGGCAKCLPPNASSGMDSSTPLAQ